VPLSSPKFFSIRLKCYTLPWHNVSISFNSSACVRIIVYNVTYNKTVLKPSNCWTLGIPNSSCDATHKRAVNNTGRNWYVRSRPLGTQLIRTKQTPWDATDTLSWPRDAIRTSPEADHYHLCLVQRLRMRGDMHCSPLCFHGLVLNRQRYKLPFLNIAAFGNMAPYNPVAGYERFGGTYSFHILPWRWSRQASPKHW
jgi:hypothetical protein